MSGRRTGEPGRAVGQRSRIGIVIAGAVVTVAGLVVSASVAGAAGDVGGGMLYAILVYLGVLFVAPRMRSLLAAAMAFGLCTLIEFAQLTGFPAALAEWFPPIRLVLGTTFVATDLAAYLAGVIVVAAAEAAARRRRPVIR